jgi:predicted PurR-regulated permease PerM
MKEELFLIILVAVFGLLAFLVLKPYLNYIIFSVILVIVSFPLYKKLKSKLNRYVSAIILIVFILLLVIVPTIFVSFKLFQQVRDVFSSIQPNIEKISDKLYLLTGIDVKENIKPLSSNIVSYVLTNIFTLTKAISKLFIGVFILLFAMFYLYIDGERILEWMKKVTPLNKKCQYYLFNHANQITQALIIGIFFTALIQGVLGGIGFFLFGIHNAIFWGVIIMFVSIIPFLGAHFVYIPASLFLMYEGNILAGIGLLVYSIIVVSNLDNLIRPRIVRFKVKIHPLIIILGVVGGIAFMGISGIILGPLILALFLELVKVYNLAKKGK